MILGVPFNVTRRPVNVVSLNQSNSGEDGTVTGFEVAGGSTYTNGFDPNVAGGTDTKRDTTGFSKTNGDETHSSSTDTSVSGSHSFKCVCPGTSSWSEGFAVNMSGLTIGQNYTVQFYLKGVNAIQARYRIATSTPIDNYLTPDNTSHKYTVTFTADATVIELTVMNTTASPQIFYWDKAQFEVGTVAHPIIPGGQTANTVKIYNAVDPTTLPSNQTRLMMMPMISEAYSQSTYTNLAAQGINTIVMSFGNLADNLGGFEGGINTFITLAKNAGLKFYAMSFFQTGNDGSVKDPSSSSYLSSMSANATQLFKDITNLDGLVFDDFVYPLSLHNQYNEATEEQTLANFASTMKTAVHAGKSTAIMGGCIYATDDAQGTDITSFANAFDIIFPEIYRMSAYSYTLVSSYVSDKITDIMGKAGSNKVVPLLLTYKTDSDLSQLWDLTTLHMDLQTILNANTAGYGWFEYLYYPDGLLNYTQTPDQGSRCIMIQTPGTNSGEGVQIPISALTPNNSQYASGIKVKAPINTGLTFELGSGATKTFTATGGWDEVFDTQIPTDQNIRVITTTAQMINLYIGTLSVVPMNRERIPLYGSGLLKLA